MQITFITILFQAILGIHACIRTSYVRRISVCACEKAGSTTWKQIVYEISYGAPGMRNARQIMDSNGDVTADNYVKNATAFINSHNGENAWYNVALIRDPLERLLAGYLDKCIHRVTSQNGTIDLCPIRKVGQDVQISFENFLTALVNIGVDRMNNHFSPQVLPGLYIVHR
jgi:hypothetical protein